MNRRERRGVMQRGGKRTYGRIRGAGERVDERRDKQTRGGVGWGGKELKGDGVRRGDEQIGEKGADDWRGAREGGEEQMRGDKE